MTFEQFQATREWADAFPEPGNDTSFRPAFTYHGGLHIFANDGGDARYFDVAGPGALRGVELMVKDFELVIANVIETSPELTELERKLYAWGMAEGYFD